MAQLESALGSGWLNLRARGAFAKMCAGLQAQLDTAASLNAEAAQMLQALFSQLNAEFGFSLNFTPAPDVSRFKNELSLIERNYGRYFNLSSALRLNSTVSSEQFHRMLVSKLRVVFENASAEIESWHQNASGQVDGQFRDRRRGFRRRRESLERIQHATGELEARLSEVETQDNKLLELADQAQAMAARLRQRAEAGPDYQDEALSEMGPWTWT
jgi:hypothetical protein